MKRALNIGYYETLHILKDKIVLVLLFLGPLVYGSFFALVYFNGIVSHIPMAIVDQDRSALSRDIKHAFANQPYFSLVEEITEYDQLEQAMQTGKVRAGLIIPEGFAEDLQQHRSSRLLTVYDASNLIWGFNIRRMANEVITTYAGKHLVDYLISMGFNYSEVRNIAGSLECNLVPWYNMNYSYSTYIFIGLMMLVVQQIALFTVSLTVTRERDANSWIQFLGADLRPWQIVAGKCLPYFIANFINYLLVLLISSTLGHISLQGSVSSLIFMGLLYDTVITLAGFVVSLHAADSLQSTRYLLVMSMPFFFISGFSWPGTHMPGVLNWLAALVPSTWMMQAARQIFVKGLGWPLIEKQILALGIMAVILCVLSLRIPRYISGPHARARAQQY